ncbi:MAG: DUF1343 domain-containing protein, partial [Candidatus Aminicenantaceae bacterium]
FRPLESTLHIIRTVKDLYPGEFEFHPEYFDKIMGTGRVRNALIQGVKVNLITEGFQKELKEFAEARKKYLLY